MSDVATVADRPAMRPARDRGALAIADRVVAKIAGRAAAEVDGVDIRTAGGVGQLFGASNPDADAQVDGTAATVTVTVSIAYPRPVFDAATLIRRRVASRLAELAGLRQVDVRVEIAELAVARGEPTRPPND